MNTIPTTFNEHTIPYTLAGGRTFDSKAGGIDAVIMSRGGWYNFSSIVKSLLSIGCSSIISIEIPNKLLDLEHMTNDYPMVKFLLPSQVITVGEGINIALSELKGELAIVLWNGQIIMEEKSMHNTIESARNTKRMCTAPVLITKSNEVLNTQMLPVLKDGHFYTETAPIIKNNTRTVYMFDFSGIYNRQKFINFGGFDYTIVNPYWQNLDFGFRTFLWGDEININTSLKLKYTSALPVEETTFDDSYTRFYLKNLKPTVKNGKAYMSSDVFFSYIKGMGLNPFNAYKYFKIGRDWVKANEERFIISPYELIANWSAM